MIQKKELIVFLLMMTQIGCQLIGPKTTNKVMSEQIQMAKDQEHEEPEIPTSNEKLKIGLILGPGGARSFGYISFLRELEKAKINISAIAGVEYGAVVAALYAQKGSANDVEWQFYKIKEEELISKNLFGKTEYYTSASALASQFKKMFFKNNIEDFNVPFSCPGHFLKQSKTYVFNKGEVVNTMMRCFVSPPFFKPHDYFYSASWALNQVVNQMRAQGINYIIYVQILDDYLIQTLNFDYSALTLWSNAYESSKSLSVDKTIYLNLKPYDIMAFDKRREIQIKAQEPSAKAVNELVLQLGL